MTPDFRRVLGRFPAGVTVVLSSWSGTLSGMTVSAFCSLSLDPPLVLFCPATGSAMGGLRVGDRFTVSVLNEGQRDLSDRFALDSDPSGTAIDPWPGPGEPGRVVSCLAALACTVEAIHPGGDHWIVVGAVTAAYQAPDPASPLVYSERAYRRLAE
jgi:flavin reductase (DIM6/NTAB) family NADH-FMN oxidoreductase RutF